VRFALAIVIASGVAIADPDTKQEAARLFEEARVLAASQAEFAKACDLFAQSLELDRAPGTELNLGDCHEHLGHLAAAWRWFADAATQFEHLGDNERAAYAHARARAVEPRLATVIVHLGGAGLDQVVVTIAGRRIDAAPTMREHVDPGAVAVHVDGRDVIAIDRTASVAAGAETTLDLALEPSKPPTPPPSHRHGWRIAFYTSATALVLATSLYFYEQAALLDTERQVCEGGGYSSVPDPPVTCGAGTPLPPSEIQRLNAQGADQSQIATAALIGAAVSFGAAAASFYPGVVRKVTVVPTVGPGKAGAVVMGRF
jgi:tetratricopeptide (TPR) repeat protein